MLSRRLALGAIVLAVLVLVGGSVTQRVLADPRVVDSAAPACGTAVDLKAKASVRRTVNINGVERVYHVQIPGDYDRATRTPLILAFHGHGEMAKWFKHYTQLSRLPAITVFPEGLRGTDGESAWQGAPYAPPQADDVAFTRAVLDKLTTEACVDSKRIYAVGRSNGAGLVNMLACQLPGRFASVAMVSGAFYPEADVGCEHAPWVSRIEFHGTADWTVPYDGEMKNGSVLPPIPLWLEGQARKAACAPPVQRGIAPNTLRIDWACQPAGAMLSHIRIDGGTHRWPGSTEAMWRPSNHINAAALIWQFFQLQGPGLAPPG
ncbi:MAG: PHB depolymerase family esterase [Gordonia sp. (in: high G+C Gram-positive bacteria)]|uniref:alpha/beta hydrolase family esterase n=1 Tax=Gordonia sp. (in: high G+C Gram-positive bacteria) TaxID=84139 RepID=UPI0039E543FB